MTSALKRLLELSAHHESQRLADVRRFLEILDSVRLRFSVV